MAAKTTKTEATEPIKATKNDDCVEIKLPYIPGGNEYVTVTANGVTYSIKCGETVRVPRNVMEILRESERMKLEYYAYIKKIKEQADDVNAHLANPFG